MYKLSLRQKLNIISDRYVIFTRIEKNGTGEGLREDFHDLFAISLQFVGESFKISKDPKHQYRERRCSTETCFSSSRHISRDYEIMETLNSLIVWSVKAPCMICRDSDLNLNLSSARIYFFIRLYYSNVIRRVLSVTEILKYKNVVIVKAITNQ